MDAQRELRRSGQLGPETRAVVRRRRGLPGGHRGPGRLADRRRSRVSHGVARQWSAGPRTQRADPGVRVFARRDRMLRRK